jgi:UDP-N-acetylmuramyl pentapeptide phosphotransferase/UDP-N-acetylglucosamine-1-phosphate transferase
MPMLNICWAALSAFLLTYFVIPSIIRVAELKHLYDAPDLPGGRKNHKTSVPTLGGIGIFAGLILSMTFWANQQQIVELQYIITALALIFLVGVKDDLINLVAYKKLIAQVAAAIIIVHFAHIRINTLYGLFGTDTIPVWVSYVLSIVTIVGVTNAFNLIDGADTLAATIGLISAVTFGIWFYLMGLPQYSILSASLAGALIAFLFYNKTPAQIFMGDTGSLIVGIVSSLLVVKFVETVRQLPLDHPFKIRSAPIFALAVLCIPIVDTLRVFILRAWQRRSPFAPDRQHLHHRLIDTGYSHMQTTAILASLNLIMIGAAYVMQGIHPEIMLFVIPAALLLFIDLFIRLRKKPFTTPSHSNAPEH